MYRALLLFLTVLLSLSMRLDAQLPAHLPVQAVAPGASAYAASAGELPKLDRKISSLEATCLRDEDAARLTGFAALKELKLTHAHMFGDAGLEKLKVMKQLEVLSIEPCFGITNEGLKCIAELPKLRVLKLRVNIGSSVGDKRRGSANGEGIKSLLGLKNLEELELSGFSNVRDSSLAVLKGLPKLRSLTLQKVNQNYTLISTPVNDALLAEFAQFPHLEALDLGYQEYFTETGLAELSKLEGLKRIALPGCEKLNEKGVLALAQCLALEEVNLAGCGEAVTNKAVAALAKLTNLRVLRLDSCSRVSDDGLKSLKDAVKLEELLLNRVASFGPSTNVTAEGIAPLAALTNLRVLELNGAAAVTSAGFTPLKTLTKLVKLDLGGMTGLDGAAYATIAGFANLEYLNLDDNRVKRDWIAALVGLKKLRVLELGITDTNVGDTTLEAIAQISSLEEFKVMMVDRFTSAGVAKLAALPNLRVLSLHRCDGVDDAALEALSALPKLESLDISEISTFTNSGLKSVGKLPALRHLYFSRADGGSSSDHTPWFDDECAAIVAKFPLLQTLILSYHNKLTDTGLKRLATCKTLRRLALDHMDKITDAGIAALTALPRLERLSAGENDHITARCAESLSKIQSLKYVHFFWMKSVDYKQFDKTMEALPWCYAVVAG